MGKLIKARKIWENGDFVGACATEFVLQCDNISGATPRLGWLIPLGTGCCGLGGGYKLEFTNPNPGDDAANVAAGIIQGVWIEGAGGGALYDATDVDNVRAACNACCDDDTTVVTARYSGTFPSPDDVAPTTFSFVRADNGGVLDLQRVMLAYLGQYVEGTFKRTSYTGGNSTYEFQAKNDPRPIGGDTFTETPRTFDSNAPGAISSGNHYVANAVIDGATMPTLEDDAYNALTDVLTAVQANATWAAKGTWSIASGKLHLSSTTTKSASIVLTVVAD